MVLTNPKSKYEKFGGWLLNFGIPGIAGINIFAFGSTTKKTAISDLNLLTGKTKTGHHGALLHYGTTSVPSAKDHCKCLSTLGIR